VFVEIPELGVREFPKDDLQPAQELENLEKKAQAPCPTGNEGCRGEINKAPEIRTDGQNNATPENRKEGENRRPPENRRDGDSRRNADSRRDGERGDRTHR
jgi:hypothetical protein